MNHCPGILCVAALLVLAGCSKEEIGTVPKDNASIRIGGLYATQDKDGWRVEKVLVVDDLAVHVRIYANKFSEQPKDVDLTKLTLGGINDPAGFGIGHAPLAKEGFLKDKPVLIKVVPVTEDELEGYKLYIEAMKGESVKH